MTQPADAFLDLGPCTYEVDGVKYGCVVNGNVGENGGNRIAPRARPHRNGEKLDFVGNQADEFALELIFNRDVGEPDVRSIWPDDAERMIEAFKTGKTGTLNLPWKRGLRVKPLTWRRTESATDNRGGCSLVVTFKTDNEDSLDRTAVQLVSVKSTLPNRVEAAEFDMESLGLDLGAIEDITELAADIVGLLNYPGDVAAALAHAGNRLRYAVNTVLGRNPLLNEPEGANAKVKLLELKELGARAVGESRQRKTRTVTYPKPTTIWAVATELGQGARDLMSINEQIEDFSFIPARTPIRVFA